MKLKLIIALIALFIGISSIWIINAVASGRERPDETINLLRITCPRDVQALRLKSFSEPYFHAGITSYTLTITVEFYSGPVWVSILNRNGVAIYSRTFSINSAGIIHVDLSNLPGGLLRLQLDTREGLYVGSFWNDAFELL